MLIVTLKRSVGRRQAQACMSTNSSFAIFPSVWVQLYPSQSQIRTHLLSIIPQTAMGPLYTSSPHILHTHIHVHMHTPPRGFLPHFHSLCTLFLFCFQCIALLQFVILSLCNQILTLFFDYQLYSAIFFFSFLLLFFIHVSCVQTWRPRIVLAHPNMSLTHPIGTSSFSYKGYSTGGTMVQWKNCNEKSDTMVLFVYFSLFPELSYFLLVVFAYLKG